MEANGTTIINRPVVTVYDYVINLANDANWRIGGVGVAERADSGTGRLSS